MKDENRLASTPPPPHLGDSALPGLFFPVASFGESTLKQNRRAEPNVAIEKYAEGLRALMRSLVAFFEIILIMAAFTVAAQVTDSLILEIAAFLTAIPLAFWVALAGKPFLDWTAGRLNPRQMLAVLLAFLAANILIPFGALKAVDGVVAAQVRTTQAGSSTDCPPPAT
jgi:hypothetical protein